MEHMNDTPQTEDTATVEPGPDAGGSDSGRDFNRDGLRTLADMRRSSDDRIVAGVCAGMARHLNVDPIIVRIAVVALTFIGLSGLILYLAAWFFIPTDDDPKSVAADWFNLDRNEEQVRTVGLFVALVLAVAAVVGDNGWGLWWLGWWIIPVAFLYWLFGVRPRRRRQEWPAAASTVVPPYPPPATGVPVPGSTEAQVADYTAWKTQQVLDRKRRRWERRRESRILRGLTLSAVLIAEAIAVIVDRNVGHIPWTGYVAVALTVVAVGCLVGTMWGTAGGLIGIGLVLTLVLTIGSFAQSGPIGEQRFTPQTASEVQPSYHHGIGNLELDLSEIVRPATLTGRTVRVTTGIGRTAITVPADVAVKLDASVQSGEVNAFGRTWRSQRSVRTTDGKGKVLHLVVTQRFGEIQVNRAVDGATTSSACSTAPAAPVPPAPSAAGAVATPLPLARPEC
jgi:phage shock protein PspC (stress-responsive transcriptional regulator)